MSALDEMMGRKRLEQTFETVRTWLFEQAYPLWSTLGTDRVAGGFFERIIADGTRLDDPRRTRLIGRQIYSFAMAHRLGWIGPARPLVRHGLEFFKAHCLKSDGSVVSTVAADGTVVNGGFDLYDHAFALFGMAAAASIGEQPGELEAIALRMIGAMRSGWKHPHAGFEESQPPSTPLKANPHMHILEASLAWQAVSTAPIWHEVADEIVELCLTHFLNPTTGALHEFFDGDWNLVAGEDMRVVEPGHQSEWSWLLSRWAGARNRPDALAAARRLSEIAETEGVDPVRDLAINELNSDLSIRDDRARLWPQTERTKALVSWARLADSADERDRACGRAADALAGMARYFGHPVSGSWWEHIDQDGRPVVEPSRASSLYHITCAISEVHSFLQDSASA